MPQRKLFFWLMFRASGMCNHSRVDYRFFSNLKCIKFLSRAFDHQSAGALIFFAEKHAPRVVLRELSSFRAVYGKRCE